MADHEVFELLSQLAVQDHGVYLKSPCGDEQLGELQAQSKSLLGEPLPESIIRLLKLSNGCQINNAYFRNAHDLLPMDAKYPQDKQFIGLGDDGTSYFVLDREDRHFHIILEGSTPWGERLKSFITFEELLLEVMKEQGVLGSDDENE